MSKDIVAKTGEYTDREGNQKAEWTKIGVILDNTNGEYVLIDPKVNLAGVLQAQNMLAMEQRKAGNDKAKTGKQVICSIFDRNGGNQQSAPQQMPADNFEDNDDIPFS